MLIRTRLSGWIALYADDCGRCFESRRSDRAWEFVERIISAGPINSSRPRDCSLRLQPGSWRANPDEETTDWRAVCGRTARTVRRAGTARAVPDPYRPWESHLLTPAKFSKESAKVRKNLAIYSKLRALRGFRGQFVGWPEASLEHVL